MAHSANKIILEKLIISGHLQQSLQADWLKHIICYNTP